MEMQVVQLTIEIADEVAAKLRADAAAGGVDASTLIETALLLYGDQASAFEAFVAEGVADADAGRVVPLEEAFAQARDIIEQARRRAG